MSACLVLGVRKLYIHGEGGHVSQFNLALTFPPEVGGVLVYSDRLDKDSVSRTPFA